MVVRAPCHLILTLVADTADQSDPNEISFSAGEILDVNDKTRKWWEVTKADGTTGSKQYFLSPSRHHSKSTDGVPITKLHPQTI